MFFWIYQKHLAKSSMKVFYTNLKTIWRTARVSTGATVLSDLCKQSIRRGLNSNVKVFADDTFLFSIVNWVNTSASTLNSDLLKIQNRAYQWKTSFNPDWTKQAQEIIFSRKENSTSHAPLFFNNSEIKLSPNQKHLGLTLDSKLSFSKHINDKSYQANKVVGLLRKL